MQSMTSDAVTDSLSQNRTDNLILEFECVTSKKKREEKKTDENDCNVTCNAPTFVFHAK